MDVNAITMFFIQFLAMSSLHSGILNFSSGASCVGYTVIVGVLQTLYAVLSLTGYNVEYLVGNNRVVTRDRQFLFFNHGTVSIQGGIFKM